MEGNQTLKYEFLVFVSGSVLLHCCVRFSVPLGKHILILYDYMLHVHVFGFSVGKTVFRGQRTIFWLFLVLAVLILTFRGVNMFRTSCNIVQIWGLVYGMCFVCSAVTMFFVAFLNFVQVFLTKKAFPCGNTTE